MAVMTETKAYENKGRAHFDCPELFFAIIFPSPAFFFLRCDTLTAQPCSRDWIWMEGVRGPLAQGKSLSP